MEEVSTVERYKHTPIHTHYIHTYTNTNLDFTRNVPLNLEKLIIIF